MYGFPNYCAVLGVLYSTPSGDPLQPVGNLVDMVIFYARMCYENPADHYMLIYTSTNNHVFIIECAEKNLSWW